MPVEFEFRVKQHYPNSMIVEEVIKSGLFGTDVTAKLLALSCLMRAHPLTVEDAL